MRALRGGRLAHQGGDAARALPVVAGIRQLDERGVVGGEDVRSRERDLQAVLTPKRERARRHPPYRVLQGRVGGLERIRLGRRRAQRVLDLPEGVLESCLLRAAHPLGRQARERLREHVQVHDVARARAGRRTSSLGNRDGIDGRRDVSTVAVRDGQGRDDCTHGDDAHRRCGKLTWALLDERQYGVRGLPVRHTAPLRRAAGTR
ncbi:hypothetical protein ACFPRL_00935 [Pseudoclavibacter helvolus]